MAPLPSPPRARIGAPDFNQHGEDWPHRDASEFHRVGQAIWHIQRMGPTTHADDTPPPIALLLHGTGASTHSLMDVMPLVARTHDTIAIDLPGHGFTQTPASFQPNQVAVAKAIKALLQQLGVQPSLIVGHSAGAAVMLALADDGLASSTALVSLNGALTPFPGIAQVLFPATAQLLTLGGITANLLAGSARNRLRVERLLEQTGGSPDAHYIDRYWTLLQCSAHVSGALRLMANWDLSRMEAIVSRLENPMLFLAGSQDQAVNPDDAARLATLAPKATALRLDRLGHLAHEQDAPRVWGGVSDWLGAVSQ